MPIPRILLTTTEPDALKQEALHRFPAESRDETSPSSSSSDSKFLLHSRNAAGARGRVPNVFWRAVRLDDLRAQRNFVALPNEAEIALCGRASFAYVRQGTETWDSLHAGRLTTGILNAALGFNEDGVNKRALGIGKHSGGHRAILNACARVARPRWLDDDVEAGEAAEAERRNARALKKFNSDDYSSDDVERSEDGDENSIVSGAAREDSVLSADASALDVLLASMSMSMPPKRHSKKNRKGGKKKARGKKNRTGGDDARMLTDSQYCRALARGGEQSIRMAWGSAQEASTLSSLMCHFEGSIVHEVGLCMLDPILLPEDIGPLPPVGASPDGMITLSNGERFVIEVKNSSPFREMPGAFVVFDREPYDAPPPYHMPQVQLEMAATNTHSAFLAMQSATRGIRVFLVQRDDAFIAAMLRRISRLYTTFILTGKDPPMNWEVHSSEHKKLVAEAVRIARSASVFALIPESLVPEGVEVDQQPFIDCSVAKSKNDSIS